MQKKLPQLHFSTKHIIKHQKKGVLHKSVHNFFLGKEREQEPHVVHCFKVLLDSHLILLMKGVVWGPEQTRKWDIGFYIYILFAFEEKPKASQRVQRKRSILWPVPLISFWKQVCFLSKNWPSGQLFCCMLYFSSSFFFSIDRPTILQSLEFWNLWHKEEVIV